ncbi:hypothetical protein FQN60_010287 [Etheostoma spectabile]|uniref:Uncharacterized protein n=1 Tax=Etheostoma spectabile TaxID=54343 RepID=A0A5J5DB51_9PERO|nr:hypothetical protein FQN60_010286 [Etheostoma spectabile]KAA8588942.1 hypothetical protein FQN60_010287 [Etheostoma spectabile]
MGRALLSDCPIS